MTVSFFQWRSVIGIFNCRVSGVSTNCECKLSRNFNNMPEILLLCYYYLESTYMPFLTLLYIFILLQCHGDIEKKPGPRKLKKVYLLNSLPPHNFSKGSQLKHIFECINTISYVYQKLTWIPQYLIVCSK